MVNGMVVKTLGGTHKLTDIFKKKIQKMEGAIHKFRTNEISFPELIKRLTNIEEFYTDG